MKWITGITLNNYRAFKNSYDQININYNEHVLIYGENGSGKSSLYYALKDFFESSSQSSLDFNLNHFSKIEGIDTGGIELEITDKDPTDNTKFITNPYKFSNPLANSNHSAQEIQLANKVKCFIDYKRLLRTHFLETPKGKNPNIFKLILEDILQDHPIKKVSGGGIIEVPLLEEWTRITDNLLKYDARYTKHKTANVELNIFNILFKNLLISVFTEFKRLMKDYFDPKLDIDVSLSDIEFDYPKWQIKKELFLNIKYSGEDINSYHEFLNEARLSSIALCIYLAAIKTYPIQASELRVLFLDDVFIGLDTNNRIPLLKLLQKEFIAEEFQIFISTYDKGWYTLMQNWFTFNKLNYNSVEMFTDSKDDDPNTPDFPVFKSHNGNVAKAKSHFQGKDYPAAGNYLRKECESIIKNLLPSTYKLDDKGEPITELEGLINKLHQLYEDCNIAAPTELLNSLKLYRKLLLNPTSHDDIDSPLFRKEIEDAFLLVEELKKIKKIDRSIVLNKGQICKINLSGGIYQAELELAECLYLTNNNGNKALSNAKYFPKKWLFNSVEYGVHINGNTERLADDKIFITTNDKKTLEKIFKGIKMSTGIEVTGDLISQVTIGETGTLKDLLL